MDIVDIHGKLQLTIMEYTEKNNGNDVPVV